MEYTKLGTLDIPKIVIGTWSWGNGDFGGKDIFGNNFGENELKEVFMSALRNGFNMYDTAALYSLGESEEILGNLSEYYNSKALSEGEIRKEILVSTKFRPKRFQDKYAMMRSLDGSLKRLKRDCVDIFWIHIPLDYKKWTKELIPILKSQKVKYVGVSNFNLDQIKEAKVILESEGFKLTAVQNHLSLMYQNCLKNGMIDWCHENDVKFFAYMVLEQGAISGKYDKDNLMPSNSNRAKIYDKNVFIKAEKMLEYIRELAENKYVAPAQISVAWSLKKGVIPIIGVTSQQHVYELTKALEIDLSDEEILKLEELGKEIEFKTVRDWEQNL